jgi:hypothetical protein
VLLTLTEFGDRILWQQGEDMLDTLRTESGRWKLQLGLARSPIAIDFMGRGRYSVRAEGVTGFLKIADLNIEIVPKFLPESNAHDWRVALWQILAVIDERPALGPAFPAITQTEASFADLLGWILLDGLRRGRMEGYPRAYQESLQVRPHLLPCIYDVFSEDTPLNRLLKWSAQALSISVRSLALSQMLAAEATAMHEVGMTPPGLVEAEYLTLPSTYHYLQPALQVGWILLRRQNLHHDVGDLQAPSFLWASSEVFERLIRYLISAVCDHDPDMYVSKHSLTLAVPEKPSLSKQAPINTVPDYLLYRGNKIEAVLDAKYKVWSGLPRTEDVYQVLAAGRIVECECVCLIYPSPVHESKAPLRWTVKANGRPTTVVAMFVDLQQMGKSNGEQQLISHLLKDIVSVLND